MRGMDKASWSRSGQRLHSVSGVDKRIDAADLTSPRPAWRWLVWFCPTYATPPIGEKADYLVGGSDDRAEADAMADGRPLFQVRENPIWRTLN
jgi:hypothetical protein